MAEWSLEKFREKMTFLHILSNYQPFLFKAFYRKYPHEYLVELSRQKEKIRAKKDIRDNRMTEYKRVWARDSKIPILKDMSRAKGIYYKYLDAKREVKWNEEMWEEMRIVVPDRVFIMLILLHTSYLPKHLFRELYTYL
jgi:hypothetical protein